MCDRRRRGHNRARVGGCSGGYRPTALPAAAKLTRLCCEGPQGFPYVHGHFDLAGVEHMVELHSATLTALGQLLHVRILADLGD